MKYINLIDLLSPEDKKKIENYITLYGVHPEYFMGVENWLQDWSHANQRLYKLLGNQFIYKVPYTYNKQKRELASEICTLCANSIFREDYSDFYWHYIKKLKDISDEQKRYFNHLFDVDNFIEDKILFESPLKYKGKDKKKTLQLQVGMKPMRAITKVIEYFSEDWAWNTKHFEEFRLEHSRIFNDKLIKANLCLSIHPLDYMTMSDNASKWQSCMNWIEDGCYRVGTVEMMNSNNVLCCYLESIDRQFNFDPYNRLHPMNGAEDTVTWNNKKWRVLTYVTKDIIMTGKSYPYDNSDVCKKILAIVKTLAAQNLSWKYSFGPELYRDMKYVNSVYPYERARRFVSCGQAKKHNILFDTKGMYNDMLNDHQNEYWCYRNKVDHTKIISVSGKAPCLCCGKSVPEHDGYEQDYNERYHNVSATICSDCQGIFHCDNCHLSSGIEKFYSVNIIDEHSSDIVFSKRLCSACFRKMIKICPDCGEPMLLADQDFVMSYDTDRKAFVNDNRWQVNIFHIEYGNYIFMCKNCAKFHLNEFNIEKHRLCATSYRRYWEDPIDTWAIFKNTDTKYMYENLKSIELKDNIKVVHAIDRPYILSQLKKELDNKKNKKYLTI